LHRRREEKTHRRSGKSRKGAIELKKAERGKEGRRERTGCMGMETRAEEMEGAQGIEKERNGPNKGVIN